jgi:hypothetical protein
VSQAKTRNTKLPPVTIFRAANKVIRPLLASPLHNILSGRLMLLTYSGRKSGKQFTIPIGYFHWNDGEILSMSSLRSWIVNLRDGRTVSLRIRRRQHTAVPTVIEGNTEIAALLKEFAQRKGAKAAKGLMLDLPGDRLPTDDELIAAAAKTRLVLFRLVG